MGNQEVLEVWKRIYEDQVERGTWNKDPDPNFPNFANDLPEGAVVLDVAYGMGRHLRAFAQHPKKFVVYGFEAMETYGQKVLKHLEEHGIDFDRVHLKHFDMNREERWSSYRDGSFDGVFAINAIHHTGDPKITSLHGLASLEANIKECARVLKQGGKLLATIASPGNHKYGKGESIDGCTWRTPAPSVEEGVPHTFASATDLAKILEKKFDLLTLHQYQGTVPKGDAAMQTSRDHWLIYAERK
jgi:SAM-dependent methyltransferase